MADKIYTTEAKIAAYINATIATGASSFAILAAQDFIDNYTGRNFKADGTASARLFSGNDRQALAIDDCVDVTKVEVGSNMWGDSFDEQVNTEGQTPQYYELPANYAADKVPIRKIGLRSRLFIGGNANHRITAKWGYSASVPDDVSLAATVIASGIYNQNRGENTGAIKSEKIGEYQVSYANEKGMNDLEQAMAILDKYKKYEI
jgi:hypothetical protein